MCYRDDIATMALPKLMILAMAAGAAGLTRRGAVGLALRGGSEEITAEAVSGGVGDLLDDAVGDAMEKSTSTEAALAVRGGSIKVEITEAEVREAQEAWGKAVVAVGKVYSDGGDYKAVGKAGLDVLYGYHSGFDVLFKPTKAKDFPIRLTEPEAVSYFVGADAVDASHSGARAEDKGFALAPFTHVRWNNYGTIIDSDSATAMGEYYFTDTKGGITKAEYTFQYRRGPDGKLKIVVHHSSIPYGG